MNYTELFVNAWKTIWKSKVIWLFYLIGYAGSFIISYGRGSSIPIVCFLLPLWFIALFLGEMGMILTVYRVVKDDHPSLADIRRLIKNYWADFLLSGFYAFWLNIVVAAVLFVIQMVLILLLYVPPIDISRSDLYLLATLSSVGISGNTFEFLTSIFFCTVVDQQLKIAAGIHRGWVQIKRNLKEISWICLIFGVVTLLTIIVNWFFPWIRYLTLLISFIITPLRLSVFVLAYLKFAASEFAPRAADTITEITHQDG